MTGIPIQVCEACAQAVFPARALCPRCGSRSSRTETARSGVAEQVTTHRRGGAIASVATELGPVVIARAADGVAPGSPVELGLDGGAPVARLSA